MIKTAISPTGISGYTIIYIFFKFISYYVCVKNKQISSASYAIIEHKNHLFSVKDRIFFGK